MIKAKVDLTRHKRAGLIHRYNKWMKPENFEPSRKIFAENLTRFRNKVLYSAGQVIDKEHAYKMGYDCGKDGPNMTNSDFRLFATQELTYEWERGKKQGEKKIKA